MQVLDVEKHRKPEQEAGQTRKSRGEVVAITPIKLFKQGFKTREKDGLTTPQILLVDTSVPQG